MDVWGPGDMLPTSSLLGREPEIVPESPPIQSSMLCESEMDMQSVIDVLQTLQRNVDNQLSSMHDKLNSVMHRMSELEGRQKILEDRIAGSSCSGPSCTPQGSVAGTKRKRITPPALQVMDFLVIPYLPTI